MGRRLLWLWRVAPEIPVRELIYILTVWWSHLSTDLIKLYTITSMHRHKWIHIKLVRFEEDQGLYLLISWLWYCYHNITDYARCYHWMKLSEGYLISLYYFQNCMRVYNEFNYQVTVCIRSDILGTVLKEAINCESWRECQGKRLRCLIQSEGVI